MKKTRFKNKSSIVLYFLKGSAIFFVLAILVSFCVTFLELIGIDLLPNADRALWPLVIG